MSLTSPSLGFIYPRILLPAPGVELKTWAVIACDQFTSQPEVWESLAKTIGDRPSTLHCILPECYLGTYEEERMIHRIHQTMRDYLDKGLLRETEPGIMLVERRTPRRTRRGVLIALDLEEYDYRTGSKPLIRPTEQTVTGRLPPRVKIRRGASLEFSHTMVLLNDPDTRVIETLFEQKANTPPTYEGDLLLNAGSVKGWFLPEPKVHHLFGALLQKTLSRSGSFLYAVGDGNHSLASAKLFWEELKTNLPPDRQLDHPARYTLVELVSLYDEGIHFEPIHRFLQPANLPLFVDFLKSCAKVSVRPVASRQEAVETIGRVPFTVALTDGNEWHLVRFTAPNASTPVEMVQEAVDSFARSHKETRVDYIHGEEALCSLTSNSNAIGILLPPLEKEKLFPLVEEKGVLPRKAFSIGESEEKRFYLEGRRIIDD